MYGHSFKYEPVVPKTVTSKSTQNKLTRDWLILKKQPAFNL